MVQIKMSTTTEPQKESASSSTAAPTETPALVEQVPQTQYPLHHLSFFVTEYVKKDEDGKLDPE